MEYKHNPPTLAELRKTREQIRQSWTKAGSPFTIFEHWALKITHGVGTIGFFFILVVWTIAWLAWNLLVPIGFRFDPAPAFVLWLLISNVIQLVLLPLIMVGQNLEGKFSEHRAQKDYEINQKAESEIEVIIAHLENQNELLLELIHKIDRK